MCQRDNIPSRELKTAQDHQWVFNTVIVFCQSVNHAMSKQLFRSLFTRLINIILFFPFQIGLKITENKKLKRRHDTSKVEKETLQHDLDVATQEKGQLQTVLDQWKQSHISEQSRLTDLDSENKVLTRELERVKRELTDNLAREPVLQEQIQVCLCYICSHWWYLADSMITF